MSSLGPAKQFRFQITFTSPIALYSSSSNSATPGISSASFSCSVRLSNPNCAQPWNVAVSAHFSPVNASYSVSDKDLESRGFVLHRTVSDLNLDQLYSVFAAVGFPKRDLDKIRIALEHTDALLWIQYSKTERPVAFARVQVTACSTRLYGMWWWIPPSKGLVWGRL